MTSSVRMTLAMGGYPLRPISLRCFCRTAMYSLASSSASAIALRERVGVARPVTSVVGAGALDVGREETATRGVVAAAGAAGGGACPTGGGDPAGAAGGGTG